MRYIPLFLVLLMQDLWAEPPPEVIRQDQHRLDQLTALFRYTPQFGEEYILACKKLAALRGTEILYAVFERAPKWQNEEGLLYVPLLAMLPRTETLAFLRKYQDSDVERESVYAEEFLVELEASDVQALVLSFRGIRWYSSTPIWGGSIWDRSEYFPPAGSKK